MDRRAWRAMVHTVAKSQTCLKRLSMQAFMHPGPEERAMVKKAQAEVLDPTLPLAGQAHL